MARIKNPLTIIKSGSTPVVDPYITFSTESGTNKLKISEARTDLNLEYSYDTTTWTIWDLTTPLEFGEDVKLYLRGTNDTLSPSGDRGITMFEFDNEDNLVDCTGRITRLLDYNGGQDLVLTDSGSFAYLFEDCYGLRTAPELTPLYLSASCYDSMFMNCENLLSTPELPALEMKQQCYSMMFWGCASITTAPELPAVILADQCYSEMFDSCELLAIAPELPATTLTPQCYYRMFYGCTSLTTAPELPATTLTESCYYDMFRDCTSLTTAPELPATTLTEEGYFGMFRGCSNISYIKCLITNPSSDNCKEWLDGVAASGTFVKASGITWPTGVSGIPTGWTVEEE